MTYSIKILPVLLLFLLTNNIVAQTQKDTLDVINQKVESLLNDWEIPGASLAIIKNGEVLLSKGYGVANLKTSLPVDEHTLFSIASCSKAFTAAGLAHLAFKGKLDWEQPVVDYLPEFEMSDSFTTKNIALKDMLSHRTGLPRHDLMWYKSGLDRYQIYERLKYLPIKRPLYKRYEYNNVMYVVAGVILEKIAGVKFEDYISENILRPLGMNETVWYNNKMKENPNHSLSYVSDKENTLVEEPLYAHGDVTNAAGGIKTSAHDMTKWLLFQLNGGHTDNDTILPVKSLVQMHESQIVMRDPKEKEFSSINYGLGWRRYNYKGRTVVDHLGAREGYWSEVTLLPNEKTAIYVNSNSGAVSTHFVSVVTFELLDYLLGLSKTDWNTRHREKHKKELKNQALAEQEISNALSSKLLPKKNLSIYKGNYLSPAFGKITITTPSANALIATFRETDFNMKYQEDESFFGKTESEFLRFSFEYEAQSHQKTTLLADFQGVQIPFEKEN